MQSARCAKTRARRSCAGEARIQRCAGRISRVFLIAGQRTSEVPDLVHFPRYKNTSMHGHICLFHREIQRREKILLYSNTRRCYTVPGEAQVEVVATSSR
jgi:hypothetical protein